MKFTDFEDGCVILGKFPDKEVCEMALEKAGGKFPLVVLDPPYGNILNEKWDKFLITDNKFCDWMIEWTKVLETMCLPQSSFYCWGGIGRPQFRPFFKYLVRCEEETGWNLSSLITWGKKRAYGINHNYLFTREECAYFVLGDIKHPRLFNIPLLDKKRGYAGYNLKYPAKSEYLRRTNVWTDITEIFKGKTHPTEKQQRLYEIPIETHTSPDEFVFDPFAGSGVAALAARKLGRKFVLIEKDEEYYNLIIKRLHAKNTTS